VPGWLRPQETLDQVEVDRGLRLLLMDGVCSQIMGSFTGGAIMIAFALMLGASNTVIGIIAAIGPLTQLLQIPTIFLVEKIKQRKLIVVLTSFVSRVFWVAIAAVPWLVPESARVTLMLVFLVLYFGFATISGGAFNSWMRDFIPEKIMGRYFAKRMAAATAVGAFCTFLSGLALDYGKNLFSTPEGIYSTLFLAGATAGLLGLGFLSAMPEPKMKIRSEGSMLSALVAPFRDANFRKLLSFLGSWNFAINLAAPFFTVYMLKRLGLSMAWVLGLSVLSQIFNVLFFKVWGRLADKFSNKSVLGASGFLFVLSIAAWPFTTMPEKYMLTIPLIVVIHALAGISTAGVNLCAGNIALKLAPRGAATSYLAMNSLVNGIAATIAPILAGIAADWFEKERLSIALKWITRGENTRFAFPAMDIKGLDFLFVIASIFGLYALHRLLAVREEGEVEEKIVMNELYASVGKAFRHVSNVAGVRHLTYFPYWVLKNISPADNDERKTND